MSFTTYNKILLISISSFIVPILILSFYMEPVSDELTRMGGYLENDYGWNKPQEHFPNPLFKLAHSIEEYQQYYDVVVVGDSFSDNESHGWQNYLVNQTGLSVISFNRRSVSVEDILSSPVYQNRPPKLFIYQFVERNVISRHKVCDSNDFEKSSEFIPPEIRIKPLDVSVDTISRTREALLFGGLNFNSSLNYLFKAVLRNLFGMNITEVHRFTLSRKGLFSSKVDDSVLVITRDFKLKKVTKPQIETAKCSLLSLQNRIRKQSETEFIALVFPDKTTAYSDYIQDRSYTEMSIARKLERTEGLNIAFLVDDFKQAVKEGAVDFYLPNDTHCGFYGYKTAAESVVKLLSHLTENKPFNNSEIFSTDRGNPL